MKTYFRFLIIFILFFVILKFSNFSFQSEILSREILSFGNTKNVTKTCLKEIQNLLENSRTVSRLKRCQSLPQPAGDFEHALKHLSTKPKSNCFSNEKIHDEIFPREHLNYLKGRQADPALKWLFDRLQKIAPKFKRFNELGNVKNGIIYLGLLDPEIQNGIRDGIGKGRVVNLTKKFSDSGKFQWQKFS